MKLSKILGENDSDIGRKIRSNFIEDEHGVIESSGMEMLGDLRVGDISFLENKDKQIDFFIYLYTQYFRTKKIQDITLKTLLSLDKGMVERTWPIISQLWAKSVANTVYSYQHEYCFELFKNDSSIDFITCDQPVINTLPAGNIPSAIEFSVSIFFTIT
jgi:hypothetical protein